MRRFIPLALVFWAALAPAQSARREVEKSPGYFDFGDIEAFSDGDESVEVDLMQPLLGLFAGVAESEDPEMYNVLKNLQLVNVRVFSYDPDLEEKLRTHVETKSEQLRKKDWENVVKVRSKDEMMNVFVKLSNAERGKPATPETALEGLSILAVDEYQAVFVNVVGHFDMEAIQALGKHFNLPHIDELPGHERSRSDTEGR